MLTGDYIKWGVAVIAFLSIFIEISKVKFNPITFIFSPVISALSKPVITKLQTIQDEQDDFKKSIEELRTLVNINEVNRLRAEILSFATSCKRPEDVHDDEQFKHIIMAHDNYERLVDEIKVFKPDFKNGYMDVEYPFILEVYHDCVRKGLRCNGGDCGMLK